MTEAEFWAWLEGTRRVWTLNAAGQIRFEVADDHPSLFSRVPDVRRDPAGTVTDRRSFKAPADPIMRSGMTVAERDAAPWAQRIAWAANACPGFDSGVRARLMAACELQEGVR